MCVRVWVGVRMHTILQILHTGSSLLYFFKSNVSELTNIILIFRIVRYQMKLTYKYTYMMSCLDIYLNRVVVSHPPGPLLHGIC